MNWKHKALGAAAGLVLVALPAYSQTDQVDRDEMIVWFMHRANQHEIKADLRSLIDKLLPTFKQHLNMAQKLRDIVSKA